MEILLNITISSIYTPDEQIKHTISMSGNKATIRKCVEDYIDKNNIRHDSCSITFTNIETELRKYSCVDFLNNELEEFIDEKMECLIELFDLHELNLSIGIGGIGGEIERKEGIHYYIFTRGEHLPIHIHCLKQEKKCKCIVETLEIIQDKNSHSHFNSKEKSQICCYVRNNKDRILKRWSELNPNL